MSSDNPIEKVADAAVDLVDAASSEHPLCKKAMRWVRILIVVELIHLTPDTLRLFGLPVPSIELQSHASAAP